MQGDINIEVFPTFLANKSYDWWITRRRMEIYTKISKRKDLVWSQQKQGKIRTTQGGVRIWKVLCEIFAQAWSSCLPKALSVPLPMLLPIEKKSAAAMTHPGSMSTDFLSGIGYHL